MSDEVSVRVTDPEKLIAAVKKRPCLWNSSCPEYRVKSMKQDSWDEVGTEVVENWKEFSRTQKHLNVRLLIRRWNNIRDYFNKSIKSSYLAKSRGVRVARRKKYAFADALEFLRPELEKNLNGLVQEVDTVNNIKLEIEEHDEEEVDVLEDEEANITFVDTFDQNYEETEHTPKRLRYNIQEEKRDDDPDLMFLKSLLPDMKKLKDDEKFAFKYAIMDAYMGIIRKRNCS